MIPDPLATLIAHQKAIADAELTRIHAEQENQRQEHQRPAAILFGILEGGIQPRLEEARQAAHRAGIGSEVGTGQATGTNDPRRTLTLQAYGHASSLSFQVWSYRCPPVITWHRTHRGQAYSSGHLSSANHQTEVEQILQDFVRAAISI